MAKNMQPILKRCRTLGIEPSVMGVDKKSNKNPKQGKKKMSEYGLQLNEKQKVKFIYGVLEKQFRKYYVMATKKNGITGEMLLQILETRLDNVIFRLGLANTRREARQIVNHGHILVNGKKVDIPSYLVKPGEVISVNYALNPDNRNFAHLISIYGKAYFPGIAKHHSLSVAAVYQTSIKGFDRIDALSNLAFHSGRLIPRGFYASEIENRDYVATSINYALPVWYPDLGCSFIQFKRIRLNLGFDYASFNNKYAYATTSGKVLTAVERCHLLSYGGDISFDFNLFRMPDAATTSLTISIYQPHGKTKPFIKVGLGLPL